MKLSKKAQRAKELAESDLVAKMVGRDDIEYGEHTELPAGENEVVKNQVDAAKSAMPPLVVESGEAPTVGLSARVTHLLECLDNCDMPQAWCGSMYDCSEDPNAVTCVTCLENIIAYSRKCQYRLNAIKSERLEKK